MLVQQGKAVTLMEPHKPEREVSFFVCVLSEYLLKPFRMEPAQMFCALHTSV